MAQQLSKVKLDEVSLVDQGANAKAKVVIMKRHTATQQGRVCKMPCDMCGGTGTWKGKTCADCNGSGEVEKCSLHKSDSEACKAKGCEHVAKAPAGIKFNIGFPEDGSGSEIQSVIFDNTKWDKTKAVQWLKDHDMVSAKVDETPNTLRYRQKDPAGFKTFRVITPGANVGKSLKAADGFNQLQNLIGEGLREQFQNSGKDALGNKIPELRDSQMGLAANAYVYVRDLFQDSVIFDQDGQTFRSNYTIDTDNEGEPFVEFETPVLTEVVYQDVKKIEETPQIPAEVLIKLGKLQARTTLLDRRIDKLRSGR